MKAYITGLVTGVDVDEAIDALNAVSDLSRESCENLVRDLFVKGIARRTPVMEKAPPDDWYKFMCHFEYESWIPEKDDAVSPLKLFRVTMLSHYTPNSAQYTHTVLILSPEGWDAKQAVLKDKQFVNQTVEWVTVDEITEFESEQILSVVTTK